jgi:hypothetical protein
MISIDIAMPVGETPQNEPAAKPRGCLDSRIWYVIPVGVTILSTAARYGGAGISGIAGSAAISGIGSAALSWLGRTIFVWAREGCSGAVRECHAGVDASFAPEAVCANSVFALAPSVFVCGAGIKFLIDRDTP